MRQFTQQDVLWWYSYLGQFRHAQYSLSVFAPAAAEILGLVAFAKDLGCLLYGVPAIEISSVLLLRQVFCVA